MNLIVNGLPQAAIAKCHKRGDLNNVNVFSHSSGVWEVQDVGVGRVGYILRPLVLAYRQPPSLLYAHRTASLCAAERGISGVPSSSYKSSNLTGASP